MSSTLMSRLLQRSFLTRLFQTTGLSLALATASAAGVNAETVIVQGATGAAGANGVSLPGDPMGQPGGAGESVTANAGSVHPITFPLNRAMATGGTGGVGGNALCDDPFAGCPPGSNPGMSTSGFIGGSGGPGGQAGATAATAINSGLAEADAISVGGTGGFAGLGAQRGGDGGPGGSARADATGSSGSGNATVSASATGGSAGGRPFAASVGSGGDASASSTAITKGSGDASSSANATGGSAALFHISILPRPGGTANAMADALAESGGTATARAVATGGLSANGDPPNAANATSNAETTKGALAQALSTANGSGGQAQSTAKTGASVQSTAMAPAGVAGSFPPFNSTPSMATTNAITQAGGAGQALANPGQTVYAFATGLPDKAYSASLIGGASNVAAALLGPRDKVFGTAILGANYAPNAFGQSFTYSASSTFDFPFPHNEDLLLGLIDNQRTGFTDSLGFQSMQFSILDNGAQIFGTTFGSLAVAESFFDDRVINLGSLGPHVDLTFDYKLVADRPGGFGLDLAVGGVIPETSTWAMMLLGFAGLGFVGYRQTRRAKAHAA